jgi:hypothetical protein
MTRKKFNLDQSRAARDAGMGSVYDHSLEFREQFARYIGELPRGWIGTCEDIRQNWHGAQPHRNAWGACWNAAKRRGQLVELQTRVPMTAVSSHARRTNLHKKV